MKRRGAAFLAAIFITGLLFAGGTAEDGKEVSENAESSAINVFVSIQPQKLFVEQIAGDRAKVNVMVPPGKSPATYQPTPRQVQELGKADIFFTIGVNFEAAFLPSVIQNLPKLSIIATDRGIEKRSMMDHSHGEESDQHEEHEVGEDDGKDESEHEDEGLDPHVWMDPLLVISQAGIIRDGLIAADPAGRAVYSQGYENFTRRLEALDLELAEILAPAKGGVFFVYHPAFGYFGERYGLEQVAVETGGREPGPAMLEAVIEHAMEEGVKVIFVQPEFPQSSAQSIARAIGGVVVPAATLREDYFENMRELAGAVRKGLSNE